MNRFLISFLSLAIITSAYSQETQEARRARRGQAAGYATRDATVMSMVGWGIGLAVGIAAISALIDNDTATSSSGGSTSH